MQYIQQNWKKEWQKCAFSSVKKLWKKYQKADIADLAAVTSYVSREIESLAHELNEFDLMTKDLKMISKSITNEQN